jgi:hypothetical protein
MKKNTAFTCNSSGLSILAIGCLGLTALQSTSATGVHVDLVSRGRPGDLASGSSVPRFGSQDGRYFFQSSDAPNLVAGCSDLNNGTDVFVFDRTSSTNKLLTHSASSLAATANDASTVAAVSSDARWVLTGSLATNLVAGMSDVNLADDVFLIDQATQTTTLVSRSSTGLGTANGQSTPVAISADGRWIVFSSTATNLVEGVVDNNSGNDVYLYDRISGAVSLVSQSLAVMPATGLAESRAQSISGDGRWVVFESRSTDFVAGMAASSSNLNVFAFDRVSHNTQLVSRTQAGPGTPANGDSHAAGISHDGRWIVLNTYASNWFPGMSDTNSGYDIMLYDRSLQSTVLVSHRFDDPLSTGDASSFAHAISPDGRWILIQNQSSDILSAQTTDVLLFDRQTQSFVAVTPLFTFPIPPSENSYPGRMSDDGRWVSYQRGYVGFIPGITDSNSKLDSLLFDRLSGQTLLVSHAVNDESKTANDGSGAAITISADGRWLSYNSAASNLVAGLSDNSVKSSGYIFDRVTRSSIAMSRSAATVHIMSPNGRSYGNDISDDGRWVLYDSDASNVDLGAASALSGFSQQVFLHDTVAESTQLISHSAGTTTEAASASSYANSISQNGRWITFSSRAQNLIDNIVDGNATYDAFLYDRVAGSTELLSPTFSSASITADSGSYGTGISEDGRWVLMKSDATDLVAGASDSNGEYDVFLRDRSNNSTILVSKAFGTSATAANGGSMPWRMSEDGRFIVFTSSATNLTDGITYINASSNVFLFDRTTKAATLVSHSANPLLSANDLSFNPQMTADGRWIAFSSRATNLVGDTTDTNGAEDAFLYDRLDGSIVLVSRSAAASASTGNAASIGPQVSADGCCVAFSSLATDLVTGVVDANGSHDAFVFGRQELSTRLLSRMADLPLQTANGASTSNAISSDGQFVAISSAASDMSTEAGDSRWNVFYVNTGDSTTVLLTKLVGPPSTIQNPTQHSAIMTPDGQHLLLTTDRPNLVGNVADVNRVADVFSITLSLFSDGFE